MKKEMTIELPSETLVLLPDTPRQRGCNECLLTHKECDSLCLLAGTRYHVAQRIQYKTITKWVRIIRNLITGHYNKQPYL